MLSMRTAYFDLSIVITARANAIATSKGLQGRVVYGRSRWLCLSLAWAEVQELAFVVWEPRPRLGCDGDKFSGSQRHRCQVAVCRAVV